MKRLVSALARRPRLSLGVLTLVTLALAAGIVRLHFDSSLSSLTDPNDEALAFQRATSKIFGDEEIGVVALIADDVYTPPVLKSLGALTTALAAIDGVESALSLTSVKDPVADVFNPHLLLPAGPITAKRIPELKRRVAANPIYVPHIVAADGRAAAVNVVFSPDRVGPDGEVRIDHAIEKIVAAYHGPGKLYYTGISHIRVRAVELMRADLLRFLPLSLAAMMAVLWLTFRSFRALVLPIASQAFSVALLMGVMGWVGEPITLPTLVLPSLLLVIGASYAIHVTDAYIKSVDSQADGSRVALRVLRRLGLPVSVSALTTAVGFGSLAIHPIPAIAGLGSFAVLGIVLAAAGCLVALPLAFLSLPARRDGGRRDADEPHAGEAAGGRLLGLLDAVVGRAGAFAVDRRGLVFFISAAAFVVSIVGATRIHVDTDFLKAFRSDSDVRVAHRAIAQSLAGPNVVSVVITAPRSGYFKSVGALRRVRDFQSYLESLDSVSATLSFVDYLDEIDRGLQSSDGGLALDAHGKLIDAPPPPSFWDDPERQLPAVLEFVALSPKTFSGVVDRDFRTLKLSVRTLVSGSRQTALLQKKLRAYAGSHFTDGTSVRATGALVVASHVADRIIGGQVESVGVAFATIFIALSIMFLSLRVGVAAMIPNVLPVVVFFGVMGWFGVELNLATSIIGAVALGIAVDDTIHYMARLNRIVKTTDTQREALLLTLAAVGRPVVSTSLTLTAGFLVMVFSGFAVIEQFGALSAVTMLAALVTNIVLLPAILATVPVISAWDLVSSRLGPAPQRTIPLFNGLRGISVRLIVLLGNVRSFDAGSFIVRRGDPGNAMYLVLDGDAEVRVGGGGEERGSAPQARSLASLVRGDVFGEMGLLRATVRTADVVALSSVVVLVIDQEFLRRLRLRYPRFASRFFLNIAKILSDRLEEANRRAQAQSKPGPELAPTATGTLEVD